MQGPLHILITGAGSGIGKASAIQLATLGHHVIATDQSIELLDDLKVVAQKLDLPIRFAQLDLNSETDINAAKKYDIDVLINNGAIGESGPLAAIPMERVRRNFETNVFGTIHLTQVIAKQFLNKKSGRIIIVGSTAGLVTLPYLGAYNMTKYSLEAASDALRIELAPHGITVSLIEPGKIDTGFNQRMTKTKYDWLDSATPFVHLKTKLQEFDARFFSNEYPPTYVANDIVHAATAGNPKARYVSPRRVGPSIWLARILPSRWRDSVMKSISKI